MPSSEGSTQRTEEYESVQNIDTTRLTEGEVTDDSLIAKRKRGNSSKKATKSKKTPNRAHMVLWNSLPLELIKNSGLDNI
ncbi:hypothetical protein A0J61_11819, partial [Choanephora cucurbitarum]